MNAYLLENVNNFINIYSFVVSLVSSFRSENSSFQNAGMTLEISNSTELLNPEKLHVFLHAFCKWQKPDCFIVWCGPTRNSRVVHFIVVIHCII